MPIINPKNLNKWQPKTPIMSNEAVEEFKNVYNLVNGNLDSENIRDGSITTNKLSVNAVQDKHIKSVDASKIVGQIAINSLPDTLLNSTGGTVNGTLTFNVPSGAAILKNYDVEETTLYEGGTSDNKIKIIIGGAAIMKIVVGDNIVWQVTTDGTEIPKAFKVPVITNENPTE